MSKPTPLSRLAQRAFEGVRTAFAGVRRGDGTSWAEADVIDDWGSTAEEAAARARDPDRDWTELVDDPDAMAEWGGGGFAFLNPAGFRYYIAPLMLRGLLNNEPDHRVEFALIPHLDNKGRLSKDFLARVEILNDAQRRAIAAYIDYLAAEHWKVRVGETEGMVSERDTLEFWGKYRHAGE